MTTATGVRAGILGGCLLLVSATLVPAATGPDASGTPAGPLAFPVRTFDGLVLPARLTRPAGTPKKVLLFINGSTPSDEAGHQAAMFDADGHPFRGRHDTYARFLTVMPARGYAVATLAKRSYVYPHRRPRPGLDDFARDALALVEALKRQSVIGDERDLVIVGYSEGSIVASRLLGLLARPPAGCVLLGSATGAVDYATVTLAGWPYGGAYRARGWSDERIAAEFERQRAFAAAIGTIDEATFERVWKTEDWRGLAPWESYAVARDTRVYDPVPTLLRAKTPLLFCVGDRDTAMPLALVRSVYDRLAAGGGTATLRVIEDEVHQYLKYDVFLILDAWIASGGRTGDFVPNEQDRGALARAAAVGALQQTVAALPWTGEADRAAASLEHARTLGLEDARAWFKLGMLMTDARRWDDALFAFQTALASEPDAPHGPMTWAGHVSDMKGDRTGALAWYRQALEAYNGIPLRHDHLGITIDRAWIERRLTEPYTGPPGRQ